ncbi:MAG: hypothetical protein LBJ16_03840 [Holosporaceae bacterium]|nr:hypothetical protein [Holosporaceae bacterium]
MSGRYIHARAIQGNEGVSICAVGVPDGDLTHIADQILAPEESIRFRSSGDRARISYIAGRLAAKMAADAFLQMPSLRDICIRNGLQGNPLLLHKDYDVTLSHSKYLAVSLCHLRDIILGVDVEYIDNLRQKKIVDSIFFRRNGVHFENSPTGNCVLWTLLEATAKYLKTGIPRNNSEIFDVESSEIIGNGVLLSNLKYFPSMTAVSMVYEKTVISICASRAVPHSCFSQLLLDPEVGKIINTT